MKQYKGTNKLELTESEAYDLCAALAEYSDENWSQMPISFRDNISNVLERLYDFWKNCPLEGHPMPKTDEERQKLREHFAWLDCNSNDLMPFGKFKGTPIKDLPEDYRNWLESKLS